MKCHWPNNDKHTHTHSDAMEWREKKWKKNYKNKFVAKENGLLADYDVGF